MQAEATCGPVRAGGKQTWLPGVNLSVLTKRTLPTCSIKKCTSKTASLPGKNQLWRKLHLTKTKCLACNDNHIVHNFITICSFFFFFLTKDYLVVLGRSRWVDGATVSQGGKRGEVECSVAFITPTTMVFKFLRSTAGACSTAITTWSCSLLLVSVSLFCPFGMEGWGGARLVLGLLLWGVGGSCTPLVDSFRRGSTAAVFEPLCSCLSESWHIVLK